MENIKSIKFDAISKKIALISLIIGFILIVAGVIVIENEDSYYDDGGYSNPTTTLSLENSQTAYPGIYEYSDFEFYSTSSQRYYIHVTGGSLNSLEDSYGSYVSYESENSYSDTKVYSFYGDSYTTYEFEVYSYNNSITVKVSSYAY